MIDVKYSLLQVDYLQKIFIFQKSKNSIIFMKSYLLFNTKHFENDGPKSGH